MKKVILILIIIFIIFTLTGCSKTTEENSNKQIIWITHKIGGSIFMQPIILDKED